MIIPRNTIFNQNNYGDRLGDLWASKNIDLTSNYGKLKVSPRLLLNINTTDDAQLDAPPCAFRFFTTPSYKIWAIAGSYVWNSTGGPNTAFAQDATSGTPTSCNSDTSDMEQLGTNLFVTQASTTVKYLASDGTWNSATGTLTNSSGLHQMTKFRAQNRLYIVDGNATGVSSISGTSITSSSTYSLQNLVDGTFVKISWIASNSTRVFIGTIDFTGAPAKIYGWNGVQNSGPNEEYVLSANGSLSCDIKDDEPVVIDTLGRLLQRNGLTFVEFDRLPFEEKDTPITYFASATQRMVHYNGLSIVKDRINVLVNTQLYDTDSSIKENAPSGIWTWAKETGFVHKYSFGLMKSTGTLQDYGSSRLSRVGALQEIDVPSNGITQGTINGKFLCGARYYTDATTTSDGIFYDDTKDTHEKFGYIITSWKTAKELKDTWQDTVLRIRKLLNSTDKIAVRFRTSEETPIEITGTWASTTTANTVTDVRDYENWELEVLQGTGAGKCAKISSVAENAASGWLMTLNDAFSGVTTGTFKARIQKWTQAGQLFNKQTDEIPAFPFLSQGSSMKIQLKICFQWTGENELFDIILNNLKHE